MCLSEDCSVLATGSEDRTARIWTTKTDICECIGILKGHDDYINCVVIEDKYVLTGSADKTIRKWDMSTCDCVHVFRGHNSLINRIICTGDFVFSSSYDRSARCWDFDTGECIRVFTGHKRGVYPLIFIPIDDEEAESENYDWDGNKDILITGSADFTARAWSFETGKCIRVFKEHEGAITCMSVDATGKILFTGSTDQTVRSWDVATGERYKVFRGHTASIICMTVVNKIVYTGSSDHTGRSWVVQFADCTRIFKGHKHTVSCIKYNEGFLFTGSGDSLAHCFDAKSGAVRRVFRGHESSVNTLQLVDGKLFTGSHDATLRVWDTTGITDDTSFGAKDKGKEKTVGNEKTNHDDQPISGGDVDDERQDGANTKILIDEDENMNENPQINGNINGYV